MHSNMKKKSIISVKSVYMIYLMDIKHEINITWSKYRY